MTANQATISCIIVSYNRSELLVRAVESVLEQTLPVDEIVIADDCSTDNSRELIRNLSNTIPIIKPILRDRNIGVSANRDLAIRSASSHFITTLDGDDCYFPDKIELEYKALKHNEDAVSYSSILVYYPEKKETETWSTEGFPGGSIHSRLKFITFRQGVIPRDMMLSKDLYLRSGGMRHELRIFEDWDYKIRLAAISGPWLYSGNSGVIYRRSGKGLSSSSTLSQCVVQNRVIRDNKTLLMDSMGCLNYQLCLRRSYMRMMFRYMKAFHR